MKSLFAALVAFAISSITSFGAAAPQGLIIYTDPPSTFVNGAEFTSYANTNSAYCTIVKTDGVSEQVWNSGLIGIINYPTGQPDVTDATHALQYIQGLQRKCPQPEFRAYFQNAYARWQNALNAARRATQAASQAAPSAAPPTQTANAQTFSFITKDGSKYENVELKGRDDGGITVMTDSGVEHIDFERLAKNLQDRFHFDPAIAAAFRQTLAAGRQASADQAREMADANRTTASQIHGNASVLAFWDSQTFNQEKFVQPDNVVALDGPSYQETIDFINARLGTTFWYTGFSSIGFGEKSKRLIIGTRFAENAALVTTKMLAQNPILVGTAIFDPADISADVLTRTMRQTGDGPSVYEVVVTTKNHKQAVNYFGLSVTNPPKLVQNNLDSLVVFRTEDEIEVEKVARAFSHLLGLLGATKEAF